ncbi:cytochrome c oxidase subunit II [bacterium]|nr:cytochrome c oxidase subunit II [bacterium]
MLIAVAIPTIFTIFDNAQSPRPPEQGGLVVEAIGHQWWFEFKYPQLDLITANEVHIPVGEPINFVLRSVDVIHSFWVPKLGGKMDLIPGKVNRVWLQADRPGTYYGQCAELCGASHANMRLRVHALPRDEYEAWVAAQKAEMAPLSEDAAKGAGIFVERGCNACHTVRGLPGAVGVLGPDLTHLASRTTIASALLENTPENLARWLADPNGVKPENTMFREGPMYNGTTPPLTEAEIRYLVIFLEGLE